MDRRAKDGLRAGATAAGVAAGLMVLASTAQTPDGFVRASFGGPLAPFKQPTAADVLAVGGATDPSELAALLKGSAAGIGNAGLPDSPYRAAFEAGLTPGPPAPGVAVPPQVTEGGPTAAPVGALPFIEDPTAIPKPKSVVDAQGRVDCTGSISCTTDPITRVTTVTYPDGVVAIVQKVNDLTVVAYKTLTEFLPPSVQSVLPPVPNPPVLAAPPAPPVASVPAPVSPPEAPVMLAPTTQDTVALPAVDPGPPAPDALDPEVSRPGPRVNVTRPPMDFSPGSVPNRTGAPDGSKPDLPGLGKVKDALGSVVDSVKDAVGKAIGPGAAGKATTVPRSAGQSENDGGEP